MIEEYKYGRIIIDGKAYNSDIFLDWNSRIFNWEKSDSHLIKPGDVMDALNMNPEVIVIGNGEDGEAVIAQETQDLISGKGIKLIIDKTREAIKTFNILKENSLEEEGRQAKVIGLFHLTC